MNDALTLGAIALVVTVAAGWPAIRLLRNLGLGKEIYEYLRAPDRIRVRADAKPDGLTILLTTHYLEEADQIASRLAIVERGRIVAEGRPQELKAGLHGDAVTVDLSRPEANGRATLALERVAGVREVTLDGLALRARVDEGARAVPSVLSALESAGVAVASVTVSRPSLDDVYLQRVGRAFAAGDDREEETP